MAAAFSTFTTGTGSSSTDLRLGPGPAGKQLWHLVLSQSTASFHQRTLALPDHTDHQDHADHHTAYEGEEGVGHTVLGHVLLHLKVSLGGLHNVVDVVHHGGQSFGGGAGDLLLVHVVIHLRSPDKYPPLSQLLISHVFLAIPLPPRPVSTSHLTCLSRFLT